MGTKRLGLVLAIIAVLGTGGFFIGRQLSGGGSGAQQPSVFDQLQAIQTQEAQKQVEPRFVGELLGIYIAPTLDQLPQDLRAENQRLVAGGCKGIPTGQASAFDFSRPLVMPAGYTLSAQDSADVGSNPWAIACSGTPASLGRDYSLAGAGGAPANVSIVRSAGRYDVQDVAKSQVSKQTIGGREAVIVRPASTGGLAQRYLIYLPETFGMTFLHTFNLPEAAVLKVAEAVAEATR